MTFIKIDSIIRSISKYKPQESALTLKSRLEDQNSIGSGHNSENKKLKTSFVFSLDLE